jgi:hypothetical protein
MYGFDNELTLADDHDIVIFFWFISKLGPSLDGCVFSLLVTVAAWMHHESVAVDGCCGGGGSNHRGHCYRSPIEIRIVRCIRCTSGMI